MALLNAGLAMLTIGYILGVWTTCALHQWSPRRQSREGPRPSVLSDHAMPEVEWISEPRR